MTRAAVGRDNMNDPQQKAGTLERDESPSLTTLPELSITRAGRTGTVCPTHLHLASPAPHPPPFHSNNWNLSGRALLSSGNH